MSASPPLPLLGSNTEDQGDYLRKSLLQFSRVVGRGWSIVNFYDVANSPETAHKIHERNNGSGVDLTYHHAELSEHLPQPYGIRAILEMATSLEIANAGKAVAVAALAIWHTGLEDYLMRLLRLTAVVNRSAVLAELAERKPATIARLREAGVEGAENDAIEHWLKELAKESLPKKWDINFVYTPPTNVIEPAVPYDRDWLVKFDEARHNGVHHDGALAMSFNLHEANTRLYFNGFSLAHGYAATYGIPFRFP